MKPHTFLFGLGAFWNLIWMYVAALQGSGFWCGIAVLMFVVCFLAMMVTLEEL